MSHEIREKDCGSEIDGDLREREKEEESREEFRERKYCFKREER